DFGTSSAFSVVLLVLVGILFSFYGRLSRDADRFASVTGKGFRPRPLDLGRGRWVAGGFILFMFVLLVILPLIALSWMALTPYLQAFTARGFQRLTTAYFTKVF